MNGVHKKPIAEKVDIHFRDGLAVVAAEIK